MRSVLIIGKYGFFVEELIYKFHKENWRIFTLTGRGKVTKPAHVFEQYEFDYDSASMEEIIRSCHSDLVIFTGAYDPIYGRDAESAGRLSLRYIRDLSNVLTSSVMVGIKHFIYISSEDVYGNEHVTDINEDVVPSPDSPKGLTISQGEGLAMHFDRVTQTEVTIARIANMYGIPSDRASCTDIFTKMCLEALTSGTLKINEKKIFSGIYIKDVIEALYLLAQAPERNNNLYHISSMKGITEGRIAQLMQEEFSHPINILDKTIGLKHRKILSNSRFSGEFSFDIRNDYKETIPEIIHHMTSHKDSFLCSGEKHKADSVKYWASYIFKRIFPFLENILLFIPVYILNNLVADNIYFSELNIYLLYVLLFAAVHGRQQAVFASLLSIIGYFLQKMRVSTGFNLLVDFRTYIWIVQISVIGLTVGHLRDKFRDMKADKEEQINFLSERLNDIIKINSSNTRIKNYFSEKVISSAGSIGRIYEITSRLDNAKVGEVLFAALDTVAEVMKTEDVSIYLVLDEEFCRLVSTSGEKAGSLGKSISMVQYREIFDVLKKKQVYINRSLDVTMPMMGNALFDEKNNMRIIIFLWDLSYDQMTLYQANLFKVVGALIYSAVVRDANHMDALAYHRFIPGTAVLQEAAFVEMTNIYKNAEQEGYTELSIFYIQVGSISLKELGNRLRALLRETDYVGVLADGDLAVLLTNTSVDESVHVKKRLEEENITIYLEEEKSHPKIAYEGGES